MHQDRMIEHYHSLATCDDQTLRIAFWDLETQASLQEPHEVVATLLAAIARPGCMTEDNTATAHDLLFRLSRDTRSPDIVRALLHGSFAAHAPTSLDCPMRRFSAAAASERVLAECKRDSNSRSKFAIALDQGQLLARVAAFLADHAVTHGDIVVAEEYLSSGILSETRADRLRFRVAFRLARHDAMYELAQRLESRGDGSFEREWTEFLAEQDYRKLLSCRGTQATPRHRALLWLAAQLYPVAGASSRSIASPTHIKRLGGIDDASDVALLDVAQMIDDLATALADAKPIKLPTRRFVAAWSSCGPEDHQLLALAAASRVTRRAGDLDLAAWFDYLYRHHCGRFSGGENTDLLMLERTAPARPIATTSSEPVFTTGQLGRSIKLSGSTAKLVGRYALARLMTTVSRGRRDQAAMLASLSTHIKQFVGDMVEMRGALQKVAQFGAVLHRHLPYELRDELSKAAITVPPLKPDRVARVLEDAYGDSSAIFSAFDYHPFACGSIGQLHRATLAATGDVVCVKVRYPGIETAIKSDFRIIRSVAPLLGAIFTRTISKTALQRWEQHLLAESDLEVEANDHQRTRDVLRDLDVIVPRVWHELCRKTILVTEYIDGQSWESFAANATQDERNQVGAMLWRSVYYPLRHADVFRYDIQPGNFLVKDGKLVLLDLAGTFSQDRSGMRSHLDFIRDFANDDVAAAAERFVRDGWTDNREIAAGAAKVSCAVFGRPLRGGEFEFTEDFVTEAFNTMLESLQPKLSVPDKSEGMLRIFWALWSMLARIRAKADWRSVLADEVFNRQDAAKSV